MFFDPLYLIIMAPALIFMIYAQIKVNSTYKKFSKVYNQRGHHRGAGSLSTIEEQWPWQMFPSRSLKAN